jgi:hypothetical protein
MATDVAPANPAGVICFVPLWLAESDEQVAKTKCLSGEFGAPAQAAIRKTSIVNSYRG